jgi:FkbM family methyltransferase
MHWLGRRFAYYREAFRHRHVLDDWAPPLLAYAGLRTLRGAQPLRVSSGLRFATAHYVDAWTILDVIGRNVYRVGRTEPWRTVIDIGANIGVFAVLAAQAAPGARIICYEPSADACGLLRTNLALNGVTAVVHQRAVTAAHGVAVLHATAASALRRLHPAGATPTTPRETVETVTLADAFDADSIDDCDFLKIDCEGSEYDILRACPASVLARVKRIALEFHEWTPGQDHQELVALLTARGFTVDAAYDPLDPHTGCLFADRARAA